ncbi:MAG: hypothetical protein ACRCY8_19680 [Dermatophilaceae bacterium]
MTDGHVASPPADAAGGSPPDVADDSFRDAPETGDPAVDTATATMAAAPDELDAQLHAGEEVHRTLQARLGDLGG